MNVCPPVFRQDEHWVRFSSQGLEAHFYHANGFPVGVYSPLLALLSENLALDALKNRATWLDVLPPAKGTDWATYADDLIDWLEREKRQPIVGIGHSMGAIATLIAAHRRPELFRALVLIEPSMLKPLQVLAVKMMPMSLKQHVEPIRSTLKKPERWPDRAAFRQQYASKGAFRRFDASALDALADHAVVPDGHGGVRLDFPTRWEAWNYAHAINVMPMAGKVKTPTVVIRGKPSLFFSEQSWQQWQRRAPDAVFLEDKRYGHLFPLEAPQRCAELIQQGLNQLGIVTA